MKIAGSMSRFFTVVLVLSNCLLCIHATFAQITIGSDGLWIKKETLFSVNGLELAPAETMNLSETEVQRSTTPVTFYGSPSISQVYTFSTPITFAGVVRLHYKPEVLDGAEAGDLQLIYEDSDDGPLKLAVEADVNTKDQYVGSEFSDPVTFQLLTATAFGITPPEVSDVALVLDAPLKVGNMLKASYTFIDANPDDEDHSTVVWYRYDAPGGDEGKTAIPGATGKSYTLVAADIGKFISFEVTAHDGTAAGLTVESNRQGSVYERGIRYVKQGAAGNGYSWSDAAGDLQAMINESGIGDEVWVAAGEYQRGPSESFSMKEGMKIYGGFPATGNPGMDDRNWEMYETILKGNGNSVIQNNNNGLTAAAVLDGVTLLGGSAVDGGGVFNNQVSPTLRNVTIRDNTASHHGGGMYSINSSPVLTHVMIRNNTAEDHGGGVHQTGVGSKLTMEYVTIRDNTAGYEGGGMYVDSEANLTNITITGNKGRNGGGISNSDSGGLVLTNGTISGNKTAEQGGGVYQTSNATMTLTNSIIWNNQAGSSTTSASASVYNHSGSDLAASHSLIANSRDASGVWRTAIGTDDGGNIDADPLFVAAIDPATAPSSVGDFALQPASPAINAGDPETNEPGYSVQAGVIDLSGGARIVDGRIDIGAYERPFKQQSIDVADLEDGKLVATYGDTDFVPVVTSTTGGTVVFNLPTEDNTVASIIDGNIHIMAAGEVELLVSIAGTAAYDPASIAVPLVVAKKVLTITADADQRKLYGSTDPAFTYTTTGFVGDDSDSLLDGELAREAGEDVGTYAITVGTLSAEPNYTIEFSGTTFAIVPDYGPSANHILYVNRNVSGGNQGGSSWANAVPELADALKWAKEQEKADANWLDDETLKIYVAAGIYKPMYSPEDGANFGTYQDRDNAFLLVRDVQLYGGFDPVNDIRSLEDERILPGAAAAGSGTIFSGDFNSDDVVSGSGSSLAITNNEENAYHVVVSAGDMGTALLDGLTITGGNADGGIGDYMLVSEARVVRAVGGGIANYSSSPKLTNVIIRGNAANNGGGMYNRNAVDPLLTNVTIRENEASSGGGGIYNEGSSPVLTNITISGNKAGGGGIGSGGGIFNINSAPVLTDVVLSGNFAGNYGGGISNDMSDPVLAGVTVSGNVADNGGEWHNSGGNPIIRNSIIYGNGVKVDGGSIADRQYSLIQGHGGSGGGNIDGTSDDLHTFDIFENYVSATSGIPSTDGDFRLKAGSPAVNVGNNNALWGAIQKLDGHTDPMPDNLSDPRWGSDPDGNPRIRGSRVDLGAYESEYDDIAKVAATDAVEVDYGTALADLSLPADHTATATLADGAEVSLTVNGDTEDWMLVEPAGGSYDGDAAGDYVFEAPLVLPDADDTSWFTNTGDLKATVTVRVKKGIPEWSVSLGGETAADGATLERTYGDADALSFELTDWDGDPGDIGVVVTQRPDLIDMTDLPQVKAVGAGTAEVEVTLPETDNFVKHTTTFTVEIAPKELTVTADTDQSKVYGSADPVLTYKAAGFAWDDDESIFTGALSRQAGEDVDSYAIGIGTLVAGDNYTIAYTDADFTVTPKMLTVTADAEQGKVYGSADPVLTYKATGFEQDDDESIFAGALSREAGEDVDSYAIDIGTLVAGDNYTIAYSDADFAITPKTLTVTADAEQGKVYGSADPVLTYKAAGFAWDDDESIFAGTLSREAGEDVDSYAIGIGTLVAGDNYTIAYTDADFAITPKTLTVTADAGQGKVYGEDDPELTYRVAGFEFTDDEAVLTGTLSREGGEDVDTYAIRLGTLSSGANYTVNYMGADFAIAPKTLMVTADTDQSKVYGEDDPVLTYKAAGFAWDDDESIFAGALSREAGEDVDSYAIGIGTLVAGDNYTIAYTGTDFAITPKTLTVTADAGQDKVYGEADPVLTYKAAGFAWDDDKNLLTGRLSREPGENAGRYAITGGNLSAGSNYAIAITEEVFSISRTELTVTADAGQVKVYGSADPALTFSVTGFKWGDDEDILTGALSRKDGEDVDSYAIEQGTLDAGDNYTINYTGTDFAITPKTLTVKLSNLPKISKVYDGNHSAMLVAANHVLEGMVDGDDVIVRGAAVYRTKNVGTDKEIVVSDLTLEGADMDNYRIITTSATTTGVITAKPLAVVLDEYPLITKIYDGSAAATLHVDNYRLGGIVGADDVSVKGTATYEDGNAGTEKEITVSDFVLSGADADNYRMSVASNSTTGEIVPAVVTAVALSDSSFLYDGAEHALFVTGTLPVGTTVSYWDNSRTEVGVQEVTATITGDNYATRVLTAKLVVTPATRSINFPILPTKTYGDADFDAGADASSDEAISYTSSNLSVAEITAEGRIRIRGAGETVIVATAPENRNYGNRPEVSRVLRVHKAAQGIVFGAPAEVNRDAGSVRLDVSASSGLPVALTVDDSEVATVSGAALNVLRLGTVRITATQAGDGNYEAADPVTVTVRVTDPASDFPVRVHHAVSPNSDGINEYLIIEAVKDYPENRVRIFSRNGTVVYEASGYNNGAVAFRGVGTGQVRVPAGTYFYTAEIRVNGEWKYEKGWFVLRY